MAVIPGGLYRKIEAALHHRGETELLAAKYRDALESAASVGGGLGERVQTSANGDKLERGVIRLIDAGERLEAAARWEGVFRQLDRYFDGRDEARMARLLYGEHLPQQEVAARMYVDRQTVRRWRDAYVCHAAILAAEAGLIRMGGSDGDA